MIFDQSPTFLFPYLGFSRIVAKVNILTLCSLTNNEIKPKKKLMTEEDQVKFLLNNPLVEPGPKLKPEQEKELTKLTERHNQKLKKLKEDMEKIFHKKVAARQLKIDESEQKLIKFDQEVTIIPDNK